MGSSAFGMSRHRNFWKVRTWSRSIGNFDSTSMPYCPGWRPKPKASSGSLGLAVVAEIAAAGHAGVHGADEVSDSKLIGSQPFWPTARYFVRKSSAARPAAS